MSTKNSLKDKIKKPNATQAFFNSYDTEKTPADEVNNKDNDSPNNKNENNSNDKNSNKENINNEIDNKTYVNNDNVDVVNAKVNDNEDDVYLRDLVSGKKPTKKKVKKVFTSFYMDPDLAAEVDKIAARGEKGDKSKLINAAIRKLLEDYGVIQK